MDKYLDPELDVRRLVREWEKYGKLIIAYDFDDTVYDFHGTGDTYNYVINLLRKCRDIGAKFIVFTSCDESQYPFIKDYLEKNDIPFDKINDNVEGIPFNGRKVYYNILLDDRAGLRSAYNDLTQAIYIVRNKRRNK